tara:strand:- start:1245 stop:2372 length:1128 start_codon:yes stop_codon:yes gene_type:complete
MRILFPLLAYYPSQVGGPANTIYWLAKALSREKVDVTIVSTNLGLENNQVKTDSFIKTNYGKIYYGEGSGFNIKTIIQSLSEVKHHDIIHTNGLFDPIGLVTFFYAKLLYPSKTIICSVRGGLSPSALKYSYLRKYFVLFLYRLTNKNIYFHATSKKEIEDIKKILKINKNCFYIPNYIEPTKRFKNKIRKKKIVFLGRIHPIKSIENLIEAVSISKSFNKNNFHLDIIGTYESRYKDYYNILNDLVKKLNMQNKIKFLGHIEGEKKNKKIAESYALVLPSKSENFGNVILEALNQGTPVIASKGTPWKLVEKNNAGFYCSNDCNSLSNAIDSLISLSKKEYSEYQENCLKLIDQKYNIKNNIDNWLKVYSSYKK